MQEELVEVLSLQRDFSSTNTPEMQRRGALVRNILPNQIRGLTYVPDLTTLTDLLVKGKDGTGRKTEIPWIRLHSASRSARPTEGWYVVYLFSARGDRLYLSLNQGTTRWDGSAFRPRPESDLLARVAWARAQLGSHGIDTSRWRENIQLGARGPLGRAYEIGNVGAIEYRVDSVPEDGTLARDLNEALVLLDTTYLASDEGIDVPGESAEVSDAEAQVDLVAGSRRPGRGFRLSTVERRAIEVHAVSVATRHLESMGFHVTDVGATESFDLDATSAASHLKVEVKGTTSDGSEVLLTRNEVLLHAREYPNNALAIVHSIQLHHHDDQASPSATGGHLIFESPWQLDPERLTPIAYRYSVTALRH
ncbi:MrcB family domain-containing protein [Pimelobacter simplex]|uniref:MrcB family domain-containing protein n=1 Tax=Nocardioides simplex TaxID=2045 RepID=UPI003AAD4D1A